MNPSILRLLSPAEHSNELNTMLYVSEGCALSMISNKELANCCRKIVCIYIYKLVAEVFCFSAALKYADIIIYI